MDDQITPLIARSSGEQLPNTSPHVENGRRIDSVSSTAETIVDSSPQVDNGRRSDSVSVVNQEASGKKGASSTTTAITDPESQATEMKTLRDICRCSLTVMVSFFFLGVLTSVGHHIYYTSLEGKLVGDVNDQQSALRSVPALIQSLWMKICCF
jgi:hypothetical protein